MDHQRRGETQAMMRSMLKLPATESQRTSEGRSESICLNDPHQSSKERLKYRFVDCET